MKKWLDERFAAKRRGIHKLPERWGKCITSDKALFIILPNLTCLFRKNPHFVLERLVRLRTLLVPFTLTSFTSCICLRVKSVNIYRIFPLTDLALYNSGFPPSTFAFKKLGSSTVPKCVTVKSILQLQAMSQGVTLEARCVAIESDAIVRTELEESEMSGDLRGCMKSGHVSISIGDDRR